MDFNLREMSGLYYQWVIADLTFLEVIKSNSCMVLIPREIPRALYNWVSIGDVKPFLDKKMVVMFEY